MWGSKTVQLLDIKVYHLGNVGVILARSQAFSPHTQRNAREGMLNMSVYWRESVVVGGTFSYMGWASKRRDWKGIISDRGTSFPLHLSDTALSNYSSNLYIYYPCLFCYACHVPIFASGLYKTPEIALQYTGITPKTRFLSQPLVALKRLWLGGCAAAQTRLGHQRRHRKSRDHLVCCWRSEAC